MENRGSKSTILNGNVVKEQRVDGCCTNSYLFTGGLVLRCILRVFESLLNKHGLSKFKLGINNLKSKLFYFSLSDKYSLTSQLATL